MAFTLKLASAVIASITSSFNNSLTEYSNDASYVYTIIESLMCIYCLANAAIQFVTRAISCRSSSVITYGHIMVLFSIVHSTCQTYIVFACVINRCIGLVSSNYFKLFVYPNISIESKDYIYTTRKGMKL